MQFPDVLILARRIDDPALIGSQGDCGTPSGGRALVFRIPVDFMKKIKVKAFVPEGMLHLRIGGIGSCPGILEECVPAKNSWIEWTNEDPRAGRQWAFIVLIEEEDGTISSDVAWDIQNYLNGGVDTCSPFGLSWSVVRPSAFPGSNIIPPDAGANINALVESAAGGSFDPSSEWTLCYMVDNKNEPGAEVSASDFHNACDGKAPTITVLLWA